MLEEGNKIVFRDEVTKKNTRAWLSICPWIPLLEFRMVKLGSFRVYSEKVKTMEPPFSIGEYRVSSKVGEGSLSTVWKAERRCSGEVVALKQVYLSKLNRNLSNSLHCEINFLSSVNHPNIIRLLHAFQVIFLSIHRWKFILSLIAHPVR